MGLIINSYSNYVRYTLDHESTIEKVILEPKDWESDKDQILRDKNSHGKTIKSTGKISFPDAVVEGFENAYEYIESVYSNFGINANIILKKYILDEDDPSGNVFFIEKEVVLDLSTREVTDDEKGRSVTVNSKDSGIGQVIITRLDEKIEIERETTINGFSVPQIEYKTFDMKGKKIFFSNNLKTEDPIVLTTRLSDAQRLGFLSLAQWTKPKESAVVPLELISSADPDFNFNFAQNYMTAGSVYAPQVNPEPVDPTSIFYTNN